MDVHPSFAPHVNVAEQGLGGGELGGVRESHAKPQGKEEREADHSRVISLGFDGAEVEASHGGFILVKAWCTNCLREDRMDLEAEEFSIRPLDKGGEATLERGHGHCDGDCSTDGVAETARDDINALDSGSNGASEKPHLGTPGTGELGHTRGVSQILQAAGRGDLGPQEGQERFQGTSVGGKGHGESLDGAKFATVDGELAGHGEGGEWKLGSWARRLDDREL